MQITNVAALILIAVTLVGCGSYKGDNLDATQLEEHKREVMELEKAHLEQMQAEAKAARKRR